MPTFKASNGKWLTIVAGDAEGADQSGPAVTASRLDDPDTSPDPTGAQFQFLPPRSQPWWSVTTQAERPALLSGTELRIYAPGARKQGIPDDRLLSTSGVATASPARLRARRMDGDLRQGFLTRPFTSVFTIQKVDPINLTVLPGPVRNGDSVALMQAKDSYLHADPTTGEITSGAGKVGPDELFQFYSGADLGVRLEMFPGRDGEIFQMFLTVEDSNTRAPIPATFHLNGSPFSARGAFAANTWFDSKLEWGSEHAEIPLNIDVIPRVDPWRGWLILRWEKGQWPEWLIDRDGASLWPWK